MNLFLYDVTIPPMISGLRNLAGFLKLGRIHADDTGVPHANLLRARLFDDMMSLTGQVQRASDTAKRFAMRLGGVANVPMPDNETTFEELQQRIEKTVEFLKTVPANSVNESVAAEISLPSGSGERLYTGRSYALEFALPNFFFHVTTAYDLLRHNGVPLGKRHYLGWE